MIGHVCRRWPLADVDDPLELGELGGKLAGLLDESLVHQQEARPAILQGITIFLYRPANVQGRQNAPGPGHGKEGFDVVVGVHGKHGDRIASFQPQRL